MKVAIIGSGFAGFGAAVALTESSEVEIQVFDIGLTNPFPNQPNKVVPNAKTHHGTFFSYGVNDNRWSVGLESKRICSSHALAVTALFIVAQYFTLKIMTLKNGLLKADQKNHTIIVKF